MTIFLDQSHDLTYSIDWFSKMSINLPLSVSQHSITMAVLFVSVMPSSALDRDGDGMSDVWQRVHNIASGDTSTDIDGDGQSNIKEAEAGTDPRDPMDYFRAFDLSVTPAFDSATLSWRSVEERSYQIEQSTDLLEWGIAGEANGQNGLFSTTTFSIQSPPNNDHFSKRWPTSTSAT